MGKTRRKSQRGGNLNGNPASSWGWTLGTFGNGWTQFLNTFQVQPGQNMTTNQSNNLVPIKGGGKKHRRIHKKRGGNFVSQAAAPLVLLGLNQMAKKTQKHRHKR